ncbi:hypothetical protein EDB80DRAFT_880387 [Ilyonectria destructans]|nr:hypothetical protein EDB80DRAFT_880387 [Ilyonectria destructans]
MPAPVANEECSPTKPSTSKPASSTKLTSLNSCPLKSCCNFWGHCGTTAEFCTPASKGVPVSQGCISNCGTDIIKISPPAQFKKLVYFEGFNPSRKCLKIDVSQIDQSKYTRVHFALIDVKSNFHIHTTKTQYQWGRFKTLETMMEIVSFGGWTFSAEAPSYDIFRKGMLPENRETLARTWPTFSTTMAQTAGVPSNKVIVGVSSYGQSFRMFDPSCMEPTCLFTGLKSGATKWECTDTAGYIANAEVNRIIQKSPPGMKQYTYNSD